MKNLRSFRIKYISATHHRGERVGIYDMRFKQNDIVPYDYSKNDIKEIAIDYLSKRQITISGFFYDSINKFWYLCSEDFRPIDKNYKPWNVDSHQDIDYDTGGKA